MPEIIIKEVLRTNPWLKTEENAMDYIFEALQNKRIMKTICNYSHQNRV